MFKITITKADEEESEYELQNSHIYFNNNQENLDNIKTINNTPSTKKIKLNIKDKNNNNKNLDNFTNNLYLEEEHLKPITIFHKKNSSQNHLLHLNKYIIQLNKNDDKKSAQSKLEQNPNKRKSLFYDNISRKESMNQKSLVSSKKCNSGRIKQKKNSNTFLKLKEKSNKPIKIYYIDSIMKEFSKPKININHNNLAKELSLRSYKIKNMAENIVFKPIKSENEKYKIKNEISGPKNKENKEKKINIEQAKEKDNNKGKENDIKMDNEKEKEIKKKRIKKRLTRKKKKLRKMKEKIKKWKILKKKIF